MPLLVVLLMLTIPAVGATTQRQVISRSDASWPHFHFDPANSGYNPFENVLNSSNVSQLRPAWTVQLSQGTTPSAAVAGGTVFATDAVGVVWAIRATTGAIEWSFATGSGLHGPTVSAGHVYVGTAPGEVLSLDESTGALQWSVQLNGSIFDSVTVEGGLLYVVAATASGSDVTYALDATTGALAWSRAILADSVPAASDGSIYETSPINCSAYGLDASSGMPIWSYSTGCGEGDLGSAAFSDDTVFVNDDGSVVALDSETGRARWSRPYSGVSDSTPAVGRGVVFTASASELMAIDEATGQVLWSAPIHTRYSSPALANGVVYVGAGRFLRAFDAASGQLLWISAPRSGGFDTSPVVVDGTVYMGSGDGTITAFTLFP